MCPRRRTSFLGAVARYREDSRYHSRELRAIRTESHDGGFRLLSWRYELTALRPWLNSVFKGAIHTSPFWRCANRLSDPADVTRNQGHGSRPYAAMKILQQRRARGLDWPPHLQSVETQTRPFRLSHAAPDIATSTAPGGKSVGLLLSARLFQSHKTIYPVSDYSIDEDLTYVDDRTDVALKGD